MPTGQVALKALHPTQLWLCATDFNRQRWMLRAPQGNAALRRSLIAHARHGGVHMFKT
jgi:hypothetical protein